MAYVSLANLDDVRHLSENLRPADRAELEALGMEPLQGLRSGLEFSDPAYSIIADDGEPVAMFGVTPALVHPGVGCIWLLGSEKLTKGRTLREFLKKAPRFIRWFHDRYPMLTNIIDQRNTVHQRWLRRLGFKFLKTVPAGPYQLPFIIFERRSCAPQWQPSPESPSA